MLPRHAMLFARPLMRAPDVSQARCGACIRVELIDPSTGMPVEEALPEILLQVGRACTRSHTYARTP